MKQTFAFKVGVIITLVTSLLIGGVLMYFHHVSRQAILDDIHESLVDLGHAGVQVFRDADHEVITGLRAAWLPRLLSISEQMKELDARTVQPGLILGDLVALQQTQEFAHLATLLRELQRSAEPRVYATHLLVAIPGVSPKNLAWYLADSDSQLFDPASDASARHNLAGFFHANDEVIGTTLRDGVTQVSSEWYQDSGDRFLTASIPVRNAAGQVIAAFAVDYSLAGHQERLRAISILSWQIFLVSVVVAVLLSVLVGYLISQPLYLLRVGVERIKSRDFSRSIPLRRQDEFGLLAQAFNQLSKDISQFTQQRDEQIAECERTLLTAKTEIDRLSKLLRAENEDLGSERDLLMRMRQASFPSATRLARLKGWDVSVHYQLTSRLAGEFFDVIEGPDQRIWFCMGSVSGYGVETSLMALQVRASLAGLLKFVDPGRDSAQLLARLNNELCDVNERYRLGRHVSVLLFGQQDARNLSVSGQYENPWLFRAGGAEQKLETHALGVPLGVSLEANQSFKRFALNLEGSDVLVLMSTGWLALLDKKGSNLERQLKKLIKLNVSQSSEALGQLILKTMEPVLREVKKEGVAYPDDMALAIIKRKAAS